MLLQILMSIICIGSYLLIDFLIFKKFIYQKKGLIQIIIAKYNAKKYKRTIV